ncbi:MAG: porin family protein [Thiohalomonadales bacterium]
MYNIQRSSAAIFLLLLSVSASSHETKKEVTQDIVEISLGVGFHKFDSDTPVKDGSFGTIGLGLHFSRRWAMLLQYSKFLSEVKDSSINQSINVQKYHVDGYYFYRPSHRLRPYLVFGFGQIDFDNFGSETQSETQINIGTGLSYRMTAHWSVRGDIRIFDYINNRLYDDTVAISFGYRFGNGERNE